MIVKLEIELEVLSAICVGSTADVQGIGVDKATARDGEGKLIIPGSTLKGRIRWECERIARRLGFEICNAPRTDEMCPYCWHHQGVKDDRYCFVCQTFGGSGHPANLYFGDATLAGNSRLRDTAVLQRGKRVIERRPFDAQIRSGVSISRVRRTALSERLFFTETSAPNARYHFCTVIEGHPLTTQHRALLLAGVRSLSLVGGGRSRGLGWVRVVRCFLDGEELTEIRWREVLNPLEEVRL